jgi:hypothetical protein
MSHCYMQFETHWRVRRMGVGAALVAVVGWCTATAVGQPSPASPPTQATQATQRQPVLVELFTSEGCSDCPPADALVARLDATQFVPGAQAIVLSEHVTYWNHDGWTDPFSSEEMTRRQETYQWHFSLNSSYTPQVVVDGAAQFVGSDVAALTRAVASAAAAPKAELAIEDARWEGGTVHFSVRGAPGTRANLVAALAEDATRSEVARGENAGRTLNHVAVVRVLKDFGSNAANGGQLNLPGAHLSQGNAGGPVRLVVFLADKKSGKVVAAAERTLTR